jgi:thymidylate synthase
MYRNATGAFTNLLWTVLSQGTEITVRGSKVKELLAQEVEIKYPKERCYILPHRNDNIFAKIYETLWMIAGKNNIDNLSYYLPRAPDYADAANLHIWRAAYGPRLRNWDGEHDGVDQIECAVHAITQDKYTRRAVNIIYDPGLDFVETEDIPCNNWIHWLVRPGHDIYDAHSTVDRLHMMIAQRSSDIIFGFSGINTFEWSVLQEMMAYWTGTEVGPMHYFISSLHLYEQHWKRAEKILEEGFKEHTKTMYESGIKSPEFMTDFADIDDKLNSIFMAEHTMRYYGKIANNLGLVDPFLDACWDMLKIYYYLKTYPNQHMWKIIDIINDMPTSDFKIAAVYFLSTQRKDTNMVAGLDLTDLEHEVLSL